MDEIFSIVDKEGQIIGEATRTECHSNPELIHPVVHLHIFNAVGELYLQKRAAAKDLLPGYWDTAVGGHVMAGEKIRAALLREAAEELDVEAGKAEFLYNYLWNGINETEYVHAFKLIYGGTITPDMEEVEDGRFYSLEEIEKSLGKNIFTPNFEHEYRHFLKKHV